VPTQTGWPEFSQQSRPNVLLLQKKTHVFVPNNIKKTTVDKTRILFQIRKSILIDELSAFIQHQHNPNLTFTYDNFFRPKTQNSK